MKRMGFLRLVVLAAVGIWLPSAATAQVIQTTHDMIPDFSANATIVSVASGSWSSAGTWSPARVPGPSDVVRVRHTVTYDSGTGDADVIGIEAGGMLRFATNLTTRLRVGTLMVLASGSLEVGTASNPVPASVTAEIIIKNKGLNLSIDPDQFGTGLLTINGNIVMHGAAKNPTWARVASEPRAGNTTLLLAEPVSGWRVGDALVLPDSREDPNRQNDTQLERRTVQAISADQRTVTLSGALSFTHPGARDQNGNIVLLPHVMNLTRNVAIRSESPTGTRGHTLHTNRANVDIRYVEFTDLGRTTISPLNNASNHVGRYALHLHHVFGPAGGTANGYQFTVIGNAVLDNNTARSRIKWPIAVHDSHYGLVQGNAVYNAGGSGIVTEDGNESFNLFDKNFVARVLGEGDREGRKAGGAWEPGSQGIGLWFHGGNNYVRNNVGANSVETGVEAGYGLEIFQSQVGNVRIPNFKGADTTVASQYTTRSLYTIPILEFSGNESYGNPQGLTYWWVGIEFHTPRSTADSVIRDTKIWHVSRYPFYTYHGNRVVFDGLEIYGDPAHVDCCREAHFGDYLNVNTVIRRATIVGINSLKLPYATLGTTLLENSFIATQNGIEILTSGAPGDCAGCSFPDRAQVIRNVRFGNIPGRALRTITMVHTTHNGAADTSSRNETYVYDYQGQVGNSFRVYFLEQATQNIAGGLAPCNNTTSRPEIRGITCPMTGSPPTPPPPPPLAPSAPGNVRIIR